MKAGRELDALVAEKVLYLSYCKCDGSIILNQSVSLVELMAVGGPTCNQCGFKTLAPYSTSIEAAWEVVEKLLDKEIDFTLDSFKRDDELTHSVRFNDVNFVYSESAPHAICLAALKAVGVEI